ncbi:MAG: type II toxin-antitoxin system VapC family toxin [Pseudomonadota bacterium]|nr:type II toxin-antitoxin system VapC family toxin [Pseudomonadota bacterium]
MKRTYVDANVLIAAFQGDKQVSQRALQVLDDPDRMFVVSDYLRLEVLPKPTFHKRQEEIGFMREVFESAAESLCTSSDLTGCALAMASKYDMTPIDALHIGAATVAGVDEFVTMEKPTKPICRVKEIKVVSIHSECSN